MDKVSIGIPRSLYYYYYGVFWKHFFECLDMDVVISPETNKEILSRGLSIAPDEMCLSMKIYFGHVDYLKDKCNYILVPRIDRFDDRNQTCTNFLSTYDLVDKLFDVDIIHYNIDNNNDLLDGLLSIGRQFGIGRWKIIKAYEYASKKNKMYYHELYKEQQSILETEDKKVLIISHAYNIHDHFIGGAVAKLLQKHHLNIVFSDRFDSSITNKLSSKISENLYWKYSRDGIGALELCENVDGIIFLSTFPCGLDSLVTELVMRKINKPYLNIIVDDLTSEAGLETRIESFADLLLGKYA